MAAHEPTAVRGEVEVAWRAAPAGEVLHPRQAPGGRIREEHGEAVVAAIRGVDEGGGGMDPDFRGGAGGGGGLYCTICAPIVGVSLGGK